MLYDMEEEIIKYYYQQDELIDSIAEGMVIELKKMIENSSQDGLKPVQIDAKKIVYKMLKLLQAEENL